MSNELVKADIAMQQFNAVRGKILELAERCNGTLVTDDESLEQGKELAKVGKKLETLIEDRRKEITKPYLDEKKRIDDFVKLLLAEVNDAVKVLRGRILDFEREKERIRLENLRKLEEEQRAKQAEIEKKLRESAQNQDMSAAQEALKLNEELMIDAQREAQFEQAKSSSIRKVWTYEITDENAVPRNYLMIDEKKVKQAISAGVREIPGINIFQTEQLNLR